MTILDTIILEVFHTHWHLSFFLLGLLLLTFNTFGDSGHYLFRRRCPFLHIATFLKPENDDGDRLLWSVWWPLIIGKR